MPGLISLATLQTLEMITFPIPFGRYLLLEKLATGGMAEIFKAKLVGVEGFEKTLVIKRILPFWSERQDFITMLVDEAKVLVHLNHPNIVQVYELGRVGPTYFIAMEYVEGVDLRKLLKRAQEQDRPLSQEVILTIVVEALAGLYYAHERRLPGQGPLGIVHRDISPQNILVGLGGEVKVTDFGIAKAVIQSHETQTGVLKGKYAYMSPEQAQGKHLDHRSDLFSMGIVLWELLFQRRLFACKNEIETLEKVRQAQIPWPEPETSRLYPGVREVVRQALAPRPQDRFQTAEEFLEALEDCLPKGRRTGHRKMSKVFSALIGDLQPSSEGPSSTVRQTQVVPQNLEATVSLVEAPESVAAEPQGPSQMKRGWQRFLPLALLVLWLGLAAGLSYLIVRSFQGSGDPADGSGSQKMAAPVETSIPVPAPQEPLQVAGPAVPRMGSLKIQSNPKGAQIKASYGHRVERGQGQLNMAGIPEGSEVSFEASLAGYQSGAGKIKIAFPELNVEKVVALQKKPPGYGTLKVNVAPTWGRVYVSGMGGSRDTPAVFSQVIEGTHTVRVIRGSDQKTISARAVIRPGRATTCSGNWNRGNLSCR